MSIRDGGVCTCVAEPVKLLICPDANARDIYGFCIWQESGQYTFKEAFAACAVKKAELCNSFQMAKVLNFGWVKGDSWFNSGSRFGMVLCPMVASPERCLGVDWTGGVEDEKYFATCCMQ